MKLSKIAGAMTTGALALPLIGLTAGSAHATDTAQARPQAAQVSTTTDGTVGARGKDCGFWTGGCSEIENWSKRNVRVARDWCGSGDNGAVSNGSRGPQECSGNAYEWLRPGQHSRTYAFKDTDAFQVPRGCKIDVQMNKDGQEHGKMRTYYARTGTIWVKVSNNYDVDIEKYSC